MRWGRSRTPRSRSEAEEDLGVLVTLHSSPSAGDAALSHGRQRAAASAELPEVGGGLGRPHLLPPDDPALRPWTLRVSSSPQPAQGGLLCLAPHPRHHVSPLLFRPSCLHQPHPACSLGRGRDELGVSRSHSALAHDSARAGPGISAQSILARTGRIWAFSPTKGGEAPPRHLFPNSVPFPEGMRRAETSSPPRSGGGGQPAECRKGGRWAAQGHARPPCGSVWLRAPTVQYWAAVR